MTTTSPVFFGVLAAFLISACASEAGPPEEPNDPGREQQSPPQTLSESLARLGVNEPEEPRLDEDGNVIPESYAPLGRKVTVRQVQDEDGTIRQVIGPLRELFLVGLQTDASSCVDCAVSLIDDAAFATDYANEPPTLYERSAPAPWALEELGENDFPETLRDAAGADVDADGLDEMVIVYFDAGSSQLRVSVTDSNTTDAAPLDLPIARSAGLLPISDVRVVAGNFDEDVAEELAVGVARRSPEPGPADSSAAILILDDQAEGFVLLNSISLSAMDDERSISLVLSAGNLDYDGPLELVVAQNETGRGGTTAGREIDDIGFINYQNVDTKFYVFDDVTTTQSASAEGDIEANITTPSQDGSPDVTTTYRALVSDIAIGDIDNDAIDEIVFGGVVDYWQNNNCYEVGQALVIQDDLLHDLATLDQSFFEVTLTNCPEADGVDLNFAHVNLLDIDGDGVLEVQINQHIFDQLPTDPSSWTSKYALPDTVVFRPDSQRALYDRTTSVITVGDITGDGRDDVVTYKKDVEGERLDVYGLRPDFDGVLMMERLESLALLDDVQGESRVNPIVELIDADADGNVMVSRSRHDFVLTEPIPIAVLAAPPCQLGIGQNLDSCTTTWGQSTTVGIEFGTAVELSASGTFGASFDQQVCGGVGVSTCTTIWEAEVKATIERKLSLAVGQAYELTKTVAYTSGPLEDSVVFTTIPMDIYYYELVSGDSESLSREYALSLPRAPVTYLVEISYYNANVLPDELHLEENVFEHTAGDIDTYPTSIEKISILQDRRSQVAQVRLDNLVPGSPQFLDQIPFPALPGLDVGPVAVGQGGGSTEVGIDLVKNSSFGGAIETSFKLEVQVTTAKVIAGFSIGRGLSANLSVNKGQATIYQGNVGNIEADNFVDNQYKFGLFSYLQAVPSTGQEFQVINYWVE